MESMSKEELVIKFLGDQRKPYGEIRDYVLANSKEKFGPATLTSMVKRGLIEKFGEGPYLYGACLNPRDKELIKLENCVSHWEGMMNHLVSSYNYWFEIMTELGLEDFGYTDWYNNMREALSEEAIRARTAIHKYEEQNSAF